MPALPLSDLLLYVVLALQCVGLIVLALVWRRQNSSHISALHETCGNLATGQERLEALVSEEMAGNRRETGEQARAGREEAVASTDKLTEQLGVLQRENLLFREHFSERLGTNFNSFAKSLAGQIETSGNSNKDEATRLRTELFEALNAFGGALTRQLADATELQDQRFEQFEKRLIALGERNADQIHALDDAIVEHLEALEKEAGQNWNAKRAADEETTRRARAELHESLGHLSDAVAKNFAAAGGA